jgi:hypothetical protein
VRLFRRKPRARAVAEDHAVIVHFALSDEQFGSEFERETIGDLGDRLAGIVQEAGAGEFDGDEFGGGEAVLYLYGPDRELLWAAVEPEVRACGLRPAFALLRPGGPDVTAQRLEL